MPRGRTPFGKGRTALLAALAAACFGSGCLWLGHYLWTTEGAAKID